MKELFLILLLSIIFGCNQDSVKVENRVLIDELINKGSKDKPLMYYDSKLFSGIGFNVYENQQIEREESYKNGKRVGSWKIWYMSGQLRHERKYKDGPSILDPDGTSLYGHFHQKEWHENGRIKEEYTLIDENRDIWNNTSYYSNGQIQYIADYDKDGNLGHKKLKEEGVVRAWYNNGTLEFEKEYKSGVLDGLYKEWYRNGQIKEIGNYKDGKEDGKWIYYYEDGQKMEEGNYNNGKYYFINGWDKRGNEKENELIGNLEFKTNYF